MRFGRFGSPAFVHLILLSFVAGATTTPRLVHAQPVPLDSRLKAAFVSKFPQFVGWPPPAFDGRDTLTVCVAPPNPFGRELEALVAGESLNGRPIVVRHLQGDPRVEDCHILFIPHGDDPASASLLERANARPILTVGDSPGFLDRGGIISLRVVDGRVRFDVNAAAADRSGLRISSQLLRLAVSVRGTQ